MVDTLPTFEKVFRSRAVLATDPSGAAYVEGGEATGRGYLARARKVLAAFRAGEGWAEVPRDILDLSGANPKLAKDRGAVTVGLSFLPAALSGVANLCLRAGACRLGCLVFTGQGGLPLGMRARGTLTRFALAEPDTFTALLVADLRKAQRRADREGLPLAVRLNVLSDIHWGKVLPWMSPLFPSATFYGYTKRPDIARHALAVPNVHATYSISERDKGRGAIARAVAAYGSAAVVIPKRAPFPSTVEGCPTVDGDASDLRYLDPAGAVVVLRAKGRAVAPFVRETLDA